MDSKVPVPECVTKSYNLNLSKRRALAVKEALVMQYNNPDVWHQGGRIVPVGAKS